MNAPSLAWIQHDRNGRVTVSVSCLWLRGTLLYYTENGAAEQQPCG